MVEETVTPKSRKFLRKIYESHYAQMIAQIPVEETGAVVEVGSGNGFMREVLPEVIATELRPGDEIDVCCSAMQLPFADGSIRALLMLDVLHHIKRPRDFFQEIVRTLRPGGRLIMVEPATTLWSTFVYTRFHHEDFDKAAGWELPEGDPRNVANGALPWIMLKRDCAQFRSEFPELRLREYTNVQPLRYAVSGGLSKPQLLPDWCYRPLVWIEDALPKWLLDRTGMFVQITIERE